MLNKKKNSICGALIGTHIIYFAQVLLCEILAVVFSKILHTEYSDH